LVLNATYEPLNVISLRRAIVLLIKEKAEILEAAEQRIRSATVTLPTPLVIRLVYYVRVPRQLKIPLTRRTVLIRDNYTCQYCGAHPPKGDLTIDHVFPKVHGGKTTWDNVVCACIKCNLRKGSKLLAEAQMHLLSTPERPKYVAMVFLSRATDYEAWSKYIPATEP
jgi:5-methylcytosine-specific restriction endonuclease McrA